MNGENSTSQKKDLRHYTAAAAGTHMPVLQEIPHKQQRPWATNAQLLEGLVGPYPIAAKQRACEKHLCNENRRYFFLKHGDCLNNWFLSLRES